MQFTQFLAPPQAYQPSIAMSNARSESPVEQDDDSSQGKLDVRLSGHARAVSLPTTAVMNSAVNNTEQANGLYDVEQRMYGLGLEASE
jgi:hypothetical protein